MSVEMLLFVICIFILRNPFLKICWQLVDNFFLDHFSFIHIEYDASLSGNMASK